VWSAEERAEGLEYMHPKPSSHSGRIVGKPEVTILLVLTSGLPVTRTESSTGHKELLCLRQFGITLTPF
jgi:hypothetical protein